MESSVRQQATVTTAQIDALVRSVNDIAKRERRLDNRRAPFWQCWRNTTVATLHELTAREARPGAGAGLAALALDLLAQLAQVLDHVEDLRAERTRLRVRLEQALVENAGLRADLARARETLAQRPPAARALRPARVLEARGDLQQQALRLMAAEGAGRPWRITAQMVDMGLTGNEDSGRNAVDALIAAGLVEEYREHGEPARFKLRGRGRKLVRLTAEGALLYRETYGLEPAACELDAMASRHGGNLAHAVAILEARDNLRACGYQVDDAPAPIPAPGAKAGGQRAEPDLVAGQAGERWPVEVQRQVDARKSLKWAKSLELAGRLILIVPTEQAAARQEKLISAARQVGKLPAGTVLLTSLEVMERPGWQWRMP